MAIKNLGRVVGLSAYEIWLQQGNEGTEQDYLDSLKGEKGTDGKDGVDGHTPIKGEDYFTSEEIDEIKSECKQQIVVGDITEASIMMEDNVNVQLSEPMTQLFLEFPEEIEVGYRSEITFKMSETDMTFYPDLEYDGDVAWYGQYVSDGRPYISLGSKYHIVFTYDVNGMKAVINGDEILNDTELTKNKVSEITEESKDDEYPNVDAVKNYVNNAINGMDVPGILNIDIRNMDFIEPDTELYNKIRDFTYSDETTAKIILAKQSDYNNDVTMEYIHNTGCYKGIYYNGSGIWEIVLYINNSGNRFSVSRSWSQILTVNGNQSYNVNTNNTPAHKKYVDDAITTAIEGIDIPKDEDVLYIEMGAYGPLSTQTKTIKPDNPLYEKIVNYTLVYRPVKIIVAYAGTGSKPIIYMATSSETATLTSYKSINDVQGYSGEYYIATMMVNHNTSSTITLSSTQSNNLCNDNKLSYNVTHDYNPAHKKYVDDAIAAIDIPEAEQDVYVLIPSNPDELTFFRDNTGISNNVYHNVGSDSADLRDQLKTTLQNAYNKGVDKYSIVLHIDSNDIMFGPSAMISKKPTSLTLSSQFIQQYGNSFKNAWLRKMKINVTLTWDGDVISSVYTNLTANDSRLLTGDNESAYTPTLDYHPATKKYVDDAIGDISTILSTLTTVSEVSE